MGPGEQIDDFIESGTIRLLDWNDAMTDIQLDTQDRWEISRCSKEYTCLVQEHVVNDRHVCLISDRDKGILSFIGFVYATFGQISTSPFTNNELKSLIWLAGTEMVGIPFVQVEKLPPIFGNVLTSALE
ncbi:hypothetical protein M9H77_35702 [Catharanthus roseus]|uniref:Uncharacterized protein n=1 Tax=Catharanthus roseus TaxID=4058 RepID=A0ACB9ZU01_CATRO|nr:hypothetical protein M9H77_35702 [Catharanthus roseus]